jgi:hypothetical protein
MDNREVAANEEFERSFHSSGQQSGQRLQSHIGTVHRRGGWRLMEGAVLWFITLETYAADSNSHFRNALA